MRIKRPCPILNWDLEIDGEDFLTPSLKTRGPVEGQYDPVALELEMLSAVHGSTVYLAKDAVENLAKQLEKVLSEWPDQESPRPAKRVTRKKYEKRNVLSASKAKVSALEERRSSAGKPVASPPNPETTPRAEF